MRLIQCSCHCRKVLKDVWRQYQQYDESKVKVKVVRVITTDERRIVGLLVPEKMVKTVKVSAKRDNKNKVHARDVYSHCPLQNSAFFLVPSMPWGLDAQRSSEQEQRDTEKCSDWSTSAFLI